MFLILLVSLFTLLVAAAFVQDAVRLKRMPLLDRLAPPPPDAPLVTLLIPARNEARNIARCLDGVLQQSYPNYNVVVVDDNSTDATPAILADYARRDGRLQVVQGAPLPPGWLGKC
ncbi:MAG: glycosyltransferase, partial [Chloroflexaceae bacterium]|nr:glycosyltransferase [Chloroflexaceae bacterium]